MVLQQISEVSFKFKTDFNFTSTHAVAFTLESLCNLLWDLQIEIVSYVI